MRWRWSRRSGMKTVSAWVHPAVEELMGIESRTWKNKLGVLAASGVPMAGLGFAGAPQPNTAFVNAPNATTGVTAETNLWTPATTTNADWALIPQGNFRAPQSWLVFAGGIYTSSSTAQTSAFTTRIGTSATPTSNASLGASGAISLGNATAVTNGLWEYRSYCTIRSVGTSGTAIATTTINISNQAAGSVTGTNTGMSGNTVATFDTTLQQGWVISVTPSAIGVSVQPLTFILIAID